MVFDNTTLLKNIYIFDPMPIIFQAEVKEMADGGRFRSNSNTEWDVGYLVLFHNK
jgi:hypothetical protein